MYEIHRNGEMRGIPSTIETIKKAMQIRFACGTAGYQLLRSQHQPLPGFRTLPRYMSKVDFEPGVLCQVLDALSSKVKCMNKEEKFCCITLDEMSVLPSIEYDSSTSQLSSNVNLPNHTGQSTHGLVFMLTGISSRWKQIFAYYFAGNKSDGTAFRPIILKIIEKQQVLDCTSAPLPATWVAATGRRGQVLVWRQTDISILLIKHPVCERKNLYFMADVPQVIKNLQKAIINGNKIELPVKVVTSYNLPTNRVSLLHVKDLMNFQDNSSIKLAPNLTRATLEPSHFQKMKVPGAMHLFSNSVSFGLRYLVREENLSAEYLTTAWFLPICKKWFDLMSSRHPVMALSKGNLEKYDGAVTLLKFVIQLFTEMKIGKLCHWKPVHQPGHWHLAHSRLFLVALCKPLS